MMLQFLILPQRALLNLRYQTTLADHYVLLLLQWILQEMKVITQSLFVLRSDNKDGRPLTAVSSPQSVSVSR